MTGRIAKWQTVYSALRRWALEAKPGTRYPSTVHKLAREHGINHKTVLRAIRVLVMEGIIEARRGIGIKALRVRRGVSAHERYIAYICRYPDTSEFEIGVQESIVAKANARGFSVRTIEAERVGDIIPLVQRGMVAGIIISFYHGKPSLVAAMKRLEALRLPLCTVDEHKEGYDGVVFDNYAMGRMAALRLSAQKSLRRILFLFRDSYAEPEYERERGIRDMLDEQGVPHRRVVWMPSDAKILKGYLESYWKHGLDFDAAYAHTEGTCTGLRLLYKEAGRQPPYVFSVGLQSDLEKQRMDGVIVPVREVGEAAAEMLFARMKDPDKKLEVRKIEGKVYYYRE
jgi:DNA-binding LacI/PurR family transcriptional regulator